MFDRIGHKLVITNDGQKFLPHANQILQVFNQAKLAMQPEEKLSGMIKIGTIESLLTHYIDDILTQFHELHPGVSIQVITDTPDVLINMLNTDQLDMIYLLEKSITNENWIKALEKQESVIFVSEPSREICKKTNLTIEDLLNEPIILTEQNANYRRAWDRYLSTHHLKFTPFLEISSTRYITHALKSMSAISLLPEFVVNEDLEKGTLIQLNVSGFHPEMYRQLFYHKDKWRTREMEEFIRIARNIF